MNRAALPILAAVALLMGPGEADPERYAARVNGVEISQQRVQASFDLYARQQGAEPAGSLDGASQRQLQRQVLDRLIDQELLWQQASSLDLVAGDAAVQTVVDELRGRYESERMYRSQLEAAGFDEAGFFADIRRRLSVRRLIAERIEPGLEVTDAEIREYFHDNRALFTRPAQVRARHILIKVPGVASEATWAAARARIEEILAAARRGVDFARLAREHSEDASAARGGDLGFLARGRMVAPFEEAAFALQPGAISEPVKTAFGYHIIKLEQRRDAAPAEETEASPEIRRRLLQDKRDRAIQARIAALRAGARIELSPSLGAP